MTAIYSVDKNNFLTAIKYRRRIFDEVTSAFCLQQMTHQIMCPALRKHHSLYGSHVATHYNEK
jgi:hypothetical protein